MAEWKFFDFQIVDSFVSITGDMIATINRLEQGVEENQRIGRKCTLRKLIMNYTIGLAQVNNASKAAKPDTIRVIVFLDHQTNKTAAIPGELLERQEYRSERNLSNEHRFVFLMDELHTVNYYTLTSASASDFSSAGVIKDFRWVLNCFIPIEFSGTDGLITEITSNNIGVMLIGANSTGSFHADTRVLFSDS